MMILCALGSTEINLQAISRMRLGLAQHRAVG